MVHILVMGACIDEDVDFPGDLACLAYCCRREYRSWCSRLLRAKSFKRGVLIWTSCLNAQSSDAAETQGGGLEALDEGAMRLQAIYSEEYSSIFFGYRKDSGHNALGAPGIRQVSRLSQSELLRPRTFALGSWKYNLWPGRLLRRVVPEAKGTVQSACRLWSKKARYKDLMIPPSTEARISSTESAMGDSWGMSDSVHAGPPCSDTAPGGALDGCLDRET